MVDEEVTEGKGGMRETPIARDVLLLRLEIHAQAHAPTSLAKAVLTDERSRARGGSAARRPPASARSGCAFDARDRTGPRTGRNARSATGNASLQRPKIRIRRGRIPAAPSSELHHLAPCITIRTRRRAPSRN